MKKLNKKILVTGVSGFVGNAVALALLKTDKCVLAIFRKNPPRIFHETVNSGLLSYCAGDINGRTQWGSILEGAEIVIHCAGCSHFEPDDANSIMGVCREVNVFGTLKLAQEAAATGVRRFIFISSIKVNGENTRPDHAFTEADAVAPQDAYAESKAEAELGLMSLAKQTGMEVVIIRPPLVVGPGVRGNLAKMIKWIDLGLPLPLGAVNNRRSLVTLDNLVSFLLLCADRDNSPQAINQVFVIADGEDVSTSTLYRKVAKAAGRPSRLIPVPDQFLRIAATLLGKKIIFNRLVGNLQVDASKARALLGWQPVLNLDEQLRIMFRT